MVDTYLREARIHKIKTLEDLNYHWANFLEEHYHKDKHGGIKEYYESLGASVSGEGITPLQEWNRDSRPLNYIDTSVVAEAFLHHEKRLVDKGACISFRGKKYETKPALIGFEVEIAYDPMTPEILTVHHPGIADFQARPLKIGAFCDKNPTLPVTMQEIEPKSSRFLDALEKKRDDNRMVIANAISFKGFSKGGAEHV